MKLSYIFLLLITTKIIADIKPPCSSELSELSERYSYKYKKPKGTTANGVLKAISSRLVLEEEFTAINGDVSKAIIIEHSILKHFNLQSFEEVEAFKTRLIEIPELYSVVYEYFLKQKLFLAMSHNNFSSFTPLQVFLRIQSKNNQIINDIIASDSHVQKNLKSTIFDVGALKKLTDNVQSGLEFYGTDSTRKSEPRYIAFLKKALEDKFNLKVEFLLKFEENISFDIKLLKLHPAMNADVVAAIALLEENLELVKSVYPKVIENFVKMLENYKNVDTLSLSDYNVERNRIEEWENGLIKELGQLKETVMLILHEHSVKSK